MVSRAIYRSDDIEFHYARFGGIREAILGGQFPIKYYNGWCYGGGYFSPLFYGDIFLIPFVLLSFLGIPLKTCFFIFIYVIYFAFWTVMYFLAKKYLCSDVWAILCATIFTTTNYMFYEIFGRAALGEAVAIIFYLVLLIGIYNLLFENYSKPWLLLVAFLGILFSHMTTLFFAIVTMLLVVLFNAKKLLGDKKFWIKSSLILGIFLIIGLYFIVSFIEMYFADNYSITHSEYSKSKIPSKFAQDFFDIIGVTPKFNIGVVLIFAILLRLIIIKIKYEKTEIKTIDKFLIISSILLFMVSKIFPWKLFDSILGTIQFPWRLNFIIAILLSIVVAWEIKIISKSHIKWASVFIGVMLILLLIDNSCIVFKSKWQERELNSYSNKYFYEWYLFGTNVYDFKDRNIYDNSQNAVEYERKEHTTDLNFVADENDDYYIVPIVCYKGYEATLVDENGQTSNLVIERCDNGMIKIFTNKQKGKVYLHYAGTTIQNVTFWISFMGTLVLIVGGTTYAIVKKKRKHNAENIECEPLTATSA